jgi:hypothetical protein
VNIGAAAEPRPKSKCGAGARGGIR